MIRLKSYWAEMRCITEEKSNPFRMGIGVTAYDEKDARALIQRDAIGSRDSLVIFGIREISFNEIEKNHVQKNMGVFVERGVWFPKGLNPKAIIRG